MSPLSPRFQRLCRFARRFGTVRANWGDPNMTTTLSIWSWFGSFFLGQLLFCPDFALLSGKYTTWLIWKVVLKETSFYWQHCPKNFYENVISSFPMTLPKLTYSYKIAYISSGQHWIKHHFDRTNQTVNNESKLLLKYLFMYKHWSLTRNWYMNWIYYKVSTLIFLIRGSFSQFWFLLNQRSQTKLFCQ